MHIESYDEAFDMALQDQEDIEHHLLMVKKAENTINLNEKLFIKGYQEQIDRCLDNVDAAKKEKEQAEIRIANITGKTLSSEDWKPETTTGIPSSGLEEYCTETIPSLLAHPTSEKPRIQGLQEYFGE